MTLTPHRTILFCVLPLLLILANATSAESPLGQSTHEVAPPLVKQAADYFPLSDVRLLPGEFSRAMELDRKYLLALDIDRLLAPFRTECGLPTNAKPYPGWEVWLWGHITGFYLSSASMMVASTGDAQLKKNLDTLVRGLAEVQDKFGDGYLLPTPGGHELWRKIAAGNFTVKGSMINGVFEPIYVINKIMLGLRQAYVLTGNQQARAVLIRNADWLGKEVLDKLDEPTLQKLLVCEHGSLNESMADVYALTGDPKYLAWAKRLNDRRLLDPFAQRKDILDGWHANCQIPKFTGFQRIYTYCGDERDTVAARYFWERVTGFRSWVIGGNSNEEYFFKARETEAKMLSIGGQESCNTTNMLRLTEALYKQYGEARMADYYERALYNHILSTQDPQRGCFVYFTSMRPGGYRTYDPEFNDFYCCVGTGFENHAKYGAFIYAKRDDGLTVNLFIPSELTWRERGLKVRQETRFPDEGRTTLSFQCKKPITMALQIRHPGWIKQKGLGITVNGKAWPDASAPGSYATITRQWSEGDRVEVALPMQLAVENLPGSKNYAAVLCGPIVLAEPLGREGLSDADFWTSDRWARKTIPVASVPVFAAPANDIVDKLSPVPGKPLTFQSKGLAQPRDVTLSPFYRIHFQRYAIYWRLLNDPAK